MIGIGALPNRDFGSTQIDILPAQASQFGSSHPGHARTQDEYTRFARSAARIVFISAGVGISVPTSTGRWRRASVLLRPFARPLFFTASRTTRPRSCASERSEPRLTRTARTIAADLPSVLSAPRKLRISGTDISFKRFLPMKHRSLATHAVRESAISLKNVDDHHHPKSCMLKSVTKMVVARSLVSSALICVTYLRIALVGI